MTVHRAEYVCANACGYQAAVGNGVASAADRSTPTECPRCGSGVVQA
jgi:DNA-directed RNA polymerase subunit RPC12/RpoP